MMQPHQWSYRIPLSQATQQLSGALVSVSFAGALTSAAATAHLPCGQPTPGGLHEPLPGSP